MRSSISSSDHAGDPGVRVAGRSGVCDEYARQTAADRPGIAQPVPKRPVPKQPWGRILLATAVLLAVSVGGWEAYWRSWGVVPSVANTDGLWAIQRRRIDAGEGNATVLIGASRVYFDIQLPTWERLDGQRPIQLAFEGTSPVRFAEDLAADPKFVGRLLIGVEPQMLFTGFGFRARALDFARKESPSQRIGQWLSMHFLEPHLAFYDPDYALPTVLARQPWPQRPGKTWFLDVRRLSLHEPDRNGYLWDKVVSDPEYGELARHIWRQFFALPDDAPPAAIMAKNEKEQIDRMAKAVRTMRARGVQVIFVRLPSGGEYLDFENHAFPRARTYEALLTASGAPGIYFEDYPQLRGYYMPEWSHMTHSEAERFTAALYQIITRDFWRPGAGSATASATNAGNAAPRGPSKPHPSN